MLLTFPTATAYARTSASQSNIGTATTLGFKVRVSGAYLLNSAATSSVLVLVRGAAGGTARLQIAVARAGGSVYVALTGSGGTNPQCVAILAEGNFSAGDYYVLRGWASAGGCTMEVRNAAGSVIGTQSAAGVTVSNNNAANGFVWLGDTPDLVGTTGAIDGAAVYSQEPPANVDTPDPSDTGILWGVLDDSGNIVPGATDLDEYSGASWGPGGVWDPPAPSYVGTLGGVADDASGSYSGDYAAPSVPGVLGGEAQSAAGEFSGEYAGPIIGVLGGQAGAASGGFAGTQLHAAKWGASGDSQTDQYRADANRGGGTQYEATTLGWVELLASPSLGQTYPATHHRGLDFGTWASTSLGEPRRRGFRNIWARDGATMSQGGINSQYVVTAQLPGLVSQIEDGDVTHAILGVTSNEWMNYTPLWGPNIYNGNGSTAGTGWSVAQVIDSVVGDAATWIDAVVEAGAIGVVVLGLFDFAKHPGVIELADWTNATRRGYVTSTINTINAQIEAHCDAVNIAEGRAVCAFRRLDEYLQAEVWPTADGQYVTMAGVQLDYLDSSGFDPYQMSIPGHAGTVMGGVYANTFIAAANELPGIYIAPFTDQEIRENAGIASEASGTLAGTAQAASGSFTGAYAAPEYAGALSGTAGDASGAFSGTYAAPTYAGTLSGTAGAAAGSFTGAYAAPEYAGTLAGQAEDATGTFSGAYAVPTYTGAVGGTAAAAQGGFSASYSAPAGVIGGQAGQAAGSFTGAYVAPTVTGTLGGAAGPATGAFDGTYVAPVGGVLAGVAAPAFGSFEGAYDAPEYAGVLAGVAGAADGAFGGSYFEPGVIVASLRGTAGTAYGVFAGSYEAPTGGGYFSSATFRVRPALTARIR